MCPYEGGVGKHPDGQKPTKGPIVDPLFPENEYAQASDAQRHF
jgi:hypothetical protein